MESGLLAGECAAAERRSLTFGLNFVFEGQHRDKTFEWLRFGCNFEVNFGMAA
jgi:hypothetical protein